MSLLGLLHVFIACQRTVIIIIISPRPTIWGPAIVMVRVVRLSVVLYVCHTRMCPKLSEIDIWLLGNSNRKLGFPIQNPTFWVFPGWHFAHSDRNRSVGLVNVVTGSVETVTSRHHTGHRGGPAIVTSHHGRYLILIEQ